MIINGKQLAAEAERAIVDLLHERLTAPSLAIVVTVDDPAIERYVKKKQALAEKLGITTQVVEVPADEPTAAAAARIHSLSEYHDAVIIQLPVRPDLEAETLMNAVPSARDVDVLSEAARSAYQARELKIEPPIVFAVRSVLEAAKVSLSDKQVVVVGKGRLVGEPVLLWLQREGVEARVVDADTPAEERAELLRTADVIISGVGKSGCIQASEVKAGVVLIDAGTSESAGSLKGDADPEIAKKAAVFTPVPGGLGPLTVVGLLHNVAEVAL